MATLAQGGVAVVGPQTTATRTKRITVTFPTTFPQVPVVVANALMEPGQNFSDVFAVSMVSVSTTQFVVQVYRVDAGPGWYQNLRLNWIAYTD
jgi:hypothetical protein